MDTEMTLQMMSNVSVYILTYTYLLLILRATGKVEEHIQAQINWLRSKNGFFNEKLEIRRANRNDESSHIGMFSKEKILQEEILLIIPHECQIDAGEELKY